MASTRDGGNQRYRWVPSLTEVVILAQAITNSALVFWALKEYVNNQYLQDYVGRFVSANMVMLELAVIGVGASTFGVFAKLTNFFRKDEKPLLQDADFSTSTPVRARPEVRLRPAVVSPKESGASDALAKAAARVFRQMELGQGAVAGSLPSTPVRERLDQVQGSEERSLGVTLSTSPRRLQSEQGRDARPWPEKRSLEREVAGRGDQVKWPLQQRPANVVGRTGLAPGIAEKQIAQQHFPILRPLETEQGPVDRFSHGSLGLKPAEPSGGGESKPSIRLPLPVRHVESGPLDNPVPTNPLFPIVRQSEPGQASVVEPPTRDSQKALGDGGQDSQKVAGEAPLVEKRPLGPKREGSGVQEDNRG